MSDPPIVSRDEWLVARKQLLAHEKELTRQRDTVNTERRKLPMVEIDKEYVFDGTEGKARLLDLFDGRRQLLVYHFMFDPSWDEGCPACSFVIDNLGHLSHLHARDTSLVAISRAPIEKLAAYKRRLGWTIPWYSSYGSDFNYDFHVTHDPSVAPVEYNYQADTAAETQTSVDQEFPSESPGTSAFLRVGDRIFHTYSTYARGVDQLLGTYNWLDLTARGRQEDWEEPPGRNDGVDQNWPRRHDQYGI